jgi:hypothetical protein
MVKSKINSKISFQERKEINPDDVDYESTVYILHIFDIDIPIVLGKMQYHPTNKKIAYYPIYLVSQDEIRSQIGVYEFIADRALTLLDDDGDIDLDKLSEPLLFSFVNRKYLLSANADVSIYSKNLQPKDTTKLLEVEDDVAVAKNENQDDIQEDSQDEDDDDILQLKVPKNKVSKKKQEIDGLLENGIFEIQKKFPKVQLEEEDETDAKENRNEYKLSSGNDWVENFMKNNLFRVEKLGKDKKKIESLYSILVVAFATIGHFTTNEKLKASIVAEINDELFQNERMVYSLFCGKNNELKKKKEGLKKNIDLYKKELEKKKGGKLNEKKHLVEEGQDNVKSYNETVKEGKLVNHYCKKIMDIGDRIEMFREIVQEGKFISYPLIAILEKVIHCKIIFFVEKYFEDKTPDAVLYCGSENDIAFQPKHYLMVSVPSLNWNDCVFSLITYKNKKIFEFAELPYDVRILLVNKCLELQSGNFYKIQELRNFKSKLGLEADTGNRETFLQKIEDTIEEEDLRIAKDVVFMFGCKINTEMDAGKGFGETIANNRVIDFLQLYEEKGWRKMFDDDYVVENGDACFKLDGLKWASVSHYLFASKFYNGFRNFYRKFSLDEGTEFSKDIELAKNVADLGNKKSKYADLRPKGVHIDEDYELTNNRKDRARTEALVAKFEQNADLKQILKNTQDAQLFLFQRRKKPILDIALIKLRESFLQKSHSIIKWRKIFQN